MGEGLQAMGPTTRQRHGFWARLVRLARHRWAEEGLARAMPPDLARRLAHRVAASERRHTGQIRICVEGGLPLSYLWRGAGARERALTQFGKLRVWDTEHNNGVLIYLLLADRKVEIVADRGIHVRLGNGIWEGICRQMEEAFKKSKFEAGVLCGIHATGGHLARHFPAACDKRNELPDSPVLL